MNWERGGRSRVLAHSSRRRDPCVTITISHGSCTPSRLGGVNVPLAWPSTVMTLSRTRLPAWYLHSLTSSGRTDSYAYIAFIVRRDFLQLTKLGVLVRRRCNGWGGVRRGCRKRVGRGRVGYTVLLAFGPLFGLRSIPLGGGDGGSRCLGRSNTSLGHHVVSRIKVFTVLSHQLLTCVSVTVRRSYLLHLCEKILSRDFAIHLECLLVLFAHRLPVSSRFGWGTRDIH